MHNFSLSIGVTNVTLETSTHSHRLHMDALDVVYVIVTVIMSLMSILGCLVMLAVHWKYTDLRTAGRNMLVHLTVADLLTALGNLLGVTWYLNVETMRYKMAYCKFHSALTIMSSIASFMWTVVIAWFVFWIMLHRQPSHDQRQTSCCSHILAAVCWGIPGILVFLPVTISAAALWADVLGYDRNLSQASWCWIDPSAEYSLFWSLITGKAWEVAACVGTVCLYTAVKVMLFKQAKKQKMTLSHHNRKLEEANTKLTFVPLVFIVIRIWGTIRFLLGFFAHDYAGSSGADWIVVLQGTGDSAQGFANCVIYCIFTSKIRQRILRGCHCLLFSGHQSAIKDSDYNQRCSQKRPEVSGLQASCKIQSNRVVPEFTGTAGRQREADEQKDTRELETSQEKLVDSQEPQRDHIEEDEQTHHEEQPMHVSHLPASHSIQTCPVASTSIFIQQPLESAMNNLICESHHEHMTTNLLPQNKISTSGIISSSVKETDISLDCGDVNSKEPPSLGHKNYSVWTSEVSQIYVLMNTASDIKLPRACNVRNSGTKTHLY